jgi:5-methylcytosine-specific restriction enzyme subunit McrC
MILKEYDYITYFDPENGDHKGGNSLPKHEFENLKNFILENEKINATQFLKLTTKNHKEALQAQNFVGIIQLKSNITIEILPKIAQLENDTEETIKLLIKMLKTLKNSPFKSFQLANLKTTKMPLFEIFVQMFLDELSSLVRKGIKSDYINIEENQNFLKGKLNVSGQLKYNYIHKERFYVNYDEYLPDRVENRIIKIALQKVDKISKNYVTKQRIRMFMFIFDTPQEGLSKR